MTRKPKAPTRAKVARPRPSGGPSRRAQPADAPLPVGAVALDQFVGAAAAALAIPIKPEWLSAIATNLEANLRMAALVSEFPLPDDSAPAPVFEA